jgi:hypothetical protein
MKLLKSDYEKAKIFNVSPYGAAQARELRELAESSHPLATKAKEAFDMVFSGEMSMTDGYKLVKQARGHNGNQLLSAQIPTELVEGLQDYAKAHKQLFRYCAAQAIALYLEVMKENQ